MKFLPTSLFLIALMLLLPCSYADDIPATYPGKEWTIKTPTELGLDTSKLDEIAQRLRGRGCVIYKGYVVKTWGDQAEKGDWMSSSKPVISTMLFFAIQEGKIQSVNTPIREYGWNLLPKDQGMTFHHLANMISEYARPGQPGKAFAYNDFAINLYRLTLFDRVFKESAEKVANDPNRLGPLQFQDGLSFNKKVRTKASVRDFARLGWFWLNKGKWEDRRLLQEDFFEKYVKPHVPKDLPHTQKAGDNDYLEIGSYGGGSDHFTRFGPGIYGYNFWFNSMGRDHPDAITWPDAPLDAYMTVGAGGNSMVILPSQSIVVAAARADWGNPQPGKKSSAMNEVMRLACAAIPAPKHANAATVPKIYMMSGTNQKWQLCTFDFEGPQSTETSNNPNPFLDYRLQVLFRSPGGQTLSVPGFFAGDGQGGGAGKIWRVHFTPNEPGDWTFKVSFRQGPQIAIDLNPDAGQPAAFDGTAGQFSVKDRDSEAPGFFKWGRLQSADCHYFKFADGPYWLKGGADSPEDFLAYTGFQDTPRATHAYAPHSKDWRDGDPDWNDGAGKGIIGALNYLASEEVNSIYVMPMNIGGDGKNVWPYAGKIDPKGNPANDNLHFDIGKLREWDIVFNHAQQMGILVHFVLNEAEEPNKRELDDATLGVERKLYYRELIARFGHLLALQWNLCEEYNLNIELPPEMLKACAEYIHAVDPYDSPVTVHHAGGAIKAWKPFLGFPGFAVTSFQTRDVNAVEEWRALSKQAGHPQVIGMDEFFPDKANAENADRHRREYIWPIYLSGGQIEFILEDLLKTEDFRKYEPHWRMMRHARNFMQDNLPFWEMVPQDDRLHTKSVKGEVFALPGKVYAVYLPHWEPCRLNLNDSAGISYEMSWFNPRNGKFEGDKTIVSGGTDLELGTPPTEKAEDWVVLLKKK